jgi:hypothetical protein
VNEWVRGQLERCFIAAFPQGAAARQTERRKLEILTERQ